MEMSRKAAGCECIVLWVQRGGTGDGARQVPIQLRSGLPFRLDRTGGLCYDYSQFTDIWLYCAYTGKI